MKTTEIICIIDKSGSMHSVRDDAIGGFNQFLAAQQASLQSQNADNNTGKVTGKKVLEKAMLSLVLFDTSVRTVMHRVPLATARPLSPEAYIPAGGTALLDAVGSTLATHISQPADQTIVVIITDGQENSSVEHTRQAVRAAIEALEKQGNWRFQFLGANIDAFKEAGRLGMALHSAGNAGPMRPVAMRAMMNAASRNAIRFRETGATDELNALLLDEIRIEEAREQFKSVRPGNVWH